MHNNIVTQVHRTCNRRIIYVELTETESQGLPSFRRRLLTRRYFNPAFAIAKSTDRLAKISASFGCNCGERRRVICWPINRNRTATEITRSVWLLVRISLDPFRGFRGKKRRKEKKDKVAMDFNGAVMSLRLTLILRDRWGNRQAKTRGD